jgi:hypothetical protein
MQIILDSFNLPERGTVELKVNRSFEIKVTAEEARRQVNRWLHHEVSYLLRALTPTLVVGERAIWRVPASLGLPHLGQVGTVGIIDVDVVTGAMSNTPEAKVEIERQAEALAERLPPYQPKSETPAEYLPKHVPPAPKLTLDEQGIPVIVPSLEKR